MGLVGGLSYTGNDSDKVIILIMTRKMTGSYVLWRVRNAAIDGRHVQHIYNQRMRDEGNEVKQECNAKPMLMNED